MKKMKKNKTAFVWQKTYGWMLLLNALYILIFYCLMRIFA